jgi:hypothetical protein
MAQENERLLILDLLEKGKISGEEADKLLVSLRSSDHTEIPVELESETSDVQKRAHWIRIKVTELSTGKRRFSMILPIFFIRLGILFSGRWGNIDLDRGSLEMGKEFFRKPVKGKIVDASDPEDDEHVEISFL